MSIPPMAELEILSQGDEVVQGYTVDTNAAWIAQRATELGLAVGRHSSVGDDPAAIAGLLFEAAERATEVVCTGGLGPTDDDHTADAVAAAFGLELREHPLALEQIRARYATFGRELDITGQRQARVPVGARLLENRWGTAPGFVVERWPCRLWFLPGVPREMTKMMEHHVIPGWRQRYPELEPGRLITLRCVGLGESRAQLLVRGLEHPAVRMGFRAVLPEVQIKLRFEPGAEEGFVQEHTARVREAVAAWVFSVDDSTVPGSGGSIEEVVGRALLARCETVATAESCTAGRVAAALTRMPGSSAWLLEGVVVYSNAAKERLCGVPEATLIEHGAVSEPVARVLAEGVRARSGATWGLATTGIAGPGGGTEDKPVGTVHIAVAGPSGTEHRQLRLPGAREQVMERSVAAVLDLLLEHLVSSQDEDAGAQGR
jgi:nicotinamide-nucleotide amidase